MTPLRRLALLALAAALAGCLPSQRAMNGHARGGEAWSWRMSATHGRWSSDVAGSKHVAAGTAAEQEPAAAAEQEPAADDAEMTLEPDPVAPAKKPKALVARAAKAKRSQPVVDLKTSDSDEEFVNQIIDDAGTGEITMSAMELPKSKAERASAKKKLSAPVADIVPDAAKTPAPARKKHMTRAEKRRAKLLAKLEKKKAKEMEAREARLRGQRARIDEEERERVSSARKDRRRGKKHKGKFFKNGEGFIDDESAADEQEDDDAASDEDDDSGDEDSGDDEDEDDGSVVVVTTTRKKAKPAAAPARPAATKPAVSKPAAKGKLAPVKSDWRGQALDDEDPLKASKKK